MRLSGIAILRHSMDISKKKMIIEGLINSVICYCLPLYGGCTQDEINLLQSQQNKAAQLALNCPPRTHRHWMSDHLKWMTVTQLIAYHTLIAVYRIRQDKRPEFLATKLLQENRNGNILLPRTFLELYRKSFVYRGALLWNRLPSKLRKAKKIQSFKIEIRRWVNENIDRF